MIVRKPSIFIYVSDPDPDFLREICAGIEEEGVFWEVFSRDTFGEDSSGEDTSGESTSGKNTDVSTLAFEAAKDSMLGSGIGIRGVDVAMQMQGLPRGKNVEQYHMPTYAQCRKVGANSARAIKKMAFK